MSRLQRIRKQAMSLRGGIAVAGALAVAVSLTQVAGTLAAPDLVRTAKVPIATANYYPTPLPKNVRCETTTTGLIWERRAKVSWDAVPDATGYRLEVLTYNSSNPETTIKQTYTVGAGTTSVSQIEDSDRDVLYARVRTINGPAVSSGYATPPQRISWKTHTSLRTECENTGHPTLLNDRWEDDQSWSPELEFFGIAQPMVSALNELGAGADGIDDELAAIATLDDAAAETSEAEAPEAKSADATTAATSSSTSAARTSSSTVPTTSSTLAPSSPSATSPSPSTSRATSSTTATSTAPATTRATTTSTTVPAISPSTTAATTVTPVALPGGGEAKLVGDTTLVISDDEGQVCSATVREGSTLKVRSGVLEVTDARETREVDPQTCELT